MTIFKSIHFNSVYYMFHPMHTSRKSMERLVSLRLRQDLDTNHGMLFPDPNAGLKAVLREALIGK